MKFRLAILTLGLLVVSGCGTPKPATETPRAPAAQTDPVNVWISMQTGLDRMTYIADGSSVEIMLYRIAPATFSLRFEDGGGNVKRVSDWADAIQGETLVANGTYFMEDGSPSGFLITNGKRVGTLEFDADKSGVIQLAPTFDLSETNAGLTSLLDWADDAHVAQSYPFLVKNGKAAIAKESGLLARRTFIGDDEVKPGVPYFVYLGLVGDDLVSLYDLGRLLESSPIAWNRVLNLDGGPSTGLVTADPNDSDEDSLKPVANVIVVEPRESQ